MISQFRRLHSKQLRHKFRFYSHHWRTWAACFIQAEHGVGLKSERKQLNLELRRISLAAETEPTEPGSGLAMYAARLATSTRRGVNMHSGSDSDVSSLQKPEEPDFSVDEE